MTDVHIRASRRLRNIIKTVESCYLLLTTIYRRNELRKMCDFFQMIAECIVDTSLCTEITKHNI